jgi:hypothetical protein
MGREAAQSMTPIMSILGSDGTLRLTVPEGTEGAVYREYETSDGKKGSKWELVFKSLSGKISNMSFYEGDYGTNLMVTLEYWETVKDEDGHDKVGADGKPVMVQKEDTISLGTATPFGEDFMKKLPNVNLDEYVTISPFSFIDDNGKNRRGVTVKQGDVKIENFFYDKEKKKNLHKYPNPEGDTGTFTKDDWKIYFLQARKFLVKYTEENFLPKFAGRQPKIEVSTVEYPTDFQEPTI